MTRLPNNAPIIPRGIQSFAGTGCFDLPNQHALDQVFRHYFWHVHPLFPVINEVGFWEMHRTSSTMELVIQGKLSLLLLYGIMYTSSSVSYAIPCLILDSSEDQVVPTHDFSPVSWIPYHSSGNKRLLHSWTGIVDSCLLYGRYLLAYIAVI